MEPLHIRKQAHTLTLMYKITNNHIDIDPHTYLYNTNDQCTHNTPNQKYQTYHTNTHTYKHSYFPRTIRNWNRLSQRILESKTIDTQTCHHNTLTLTIILDSLPSLHTRCSPPPNSQLHIRNCCPMLYYSESEKNWNQRLFLTSDPESLHTLLLFQDT